EPEPEPEPEPMGTFPDIEWALDADQTTSNLGGTALDLTEDQVRDAITGIADSPDTDTYLTSTLALLVTGDDDIFTAADCEGLTCSAGPGGIQQIGIDDHNLVGNEYQAVMTYGGISFAQSRRTGEQLPIIGNSETTEVLTYGGWLEHHYFGVQATFDGNTEDPSQVAVFSFTFGNASGSNPDSGSGEWNGVAIGVNLLERFEDRSLLTADVTVSIADFLNPTVDVLFDSIRDLRTGDPLVVSGLTIESVDWTGLDLTDGSFAEELGDVEDPLNISQPRKRIDGRFYGPGHEEVGGIFEYASVVGSFGAKRDAE
ncbi:MAG: hypothetical protein OXN26_08355, partial [Gammaproteobacteria bacterium]|nr:hypothetical protein [Gammaproteobacteria bacterium]